MNSHNSNKLSGESSPYLLQHADNPVAWYPWGDEAFAKAKAEDKPIFLSIGYSTCHWCHVMEHESFENQQVADLMNETFVSIKVDREERPDIDNIYMTVCQLFTGSGGWPLTIIMTPDREPFFAATYLPKKARFGRMGLIELIPRIDELWRTKRSDIMKSADQILDALKKVNSKASESHNLELNLNLLNNAYDQLHNTYDASNGGFGGAPKFPTPHNLLFLLRYWYRTNDDQVLQVVENTLQQMRQGGIYDHLGFGFHRYSTDAHWLLPHFEKMLYDQAMLTMAYTEIYQITGKPEYRQTSSEIITYIQRDMTSPEGGFYSAEDADSGGKEGKFYVWAETEIKELLSPDDAELIIRLFDVKSKGNFRAQSTGNQTGENILHLEKPLSDHAVELGLSEEALTTRLESARRILFKHREKRVHPSKDDKILTDWNGLMIAALAKAGRALKSSDYENSARKAADFLLKTMRKPDGSLLHRYRNADAAIQGNLDDYAFLTWGLIELYQLTFDVTYLQNAIALTDYQMEHFWDDQQGGFFFTADDAEDLLVRTREIYDAAVPSGNSVSALNLLRLAKFTANTSYEEKASQIAQSFSNTLSQGPASATLLMCALEFALGKSQEIVIVGNPDDADTREMLKAIHRTYLPNAVTILKSPQNDSEIAKIAPFTAYHTELNHLATAYVCRNYNCALPTNSVEEMLKLLE